MAFTFSFTYAMNGNPTVPSLEWDPNPEPYIAGYNVYSGETSRNYTRFFDVGPQTSFPLTNLNAGTTYFLAVTAYDENRLESQFSDEILYTPPVDGTIAVLLPSAFAVSSGTGTLRFSGRPGQQCRVVASSDLQHWEEVHLVTLTNSVPIEYRETDAAEQPMRFYRVVSTP